MDLLTREGVALTELTFLAADNLLLARVELAGTTWRLRQDGCLENNEAISTRVLADGCVVACYIGPRPHAVNLTITSRAVSVGDLVVFPPGKLKIDVSWKDVLPDFLAITRETVHARWMKNV